jgi:predicted nucleic acid-binding protein
MQDLNFGKGESEVIALAYETNFKVLIDDLKARKVAENLGLSISGSIGVLLKAEKLGIIDSALKKTQELKEMGFYVSNELLSEIAKRKF